MNNIRQRQLDASRRELSSMVSEVEHYGEEFSGPQLLAMRKAMRALRELIAALDKPAGIPMRNMHDFDKL